jgi:prefoldin subunit 5
LISFRFLFRIGDHPLLQKSIPLQQFLTLNDKEFSEHRLKKIVPKYAIPSGIGYYFRSSKSKEDDFISQAREFVSQLEENLKQLRSKLENIVKGRRELSNSTREFGNAFNNLSNLESSFEQSEYSKILKKVSQKTEEICEIMLNHGKKQTMHIIETIQYYQGVIASIHQSFNILTTLRYSRDDSVEFLESIRKNKPDSDVEKLKKISDQTQYFYQVNILIF